MEKYTAELHYWLRKFAEEGENFHNHHYAELMLRLVEEPDDAFLRDKIVADFGCGPRGSLAWTNAPARSFGIDVLVPAYLRSFGACMAGHSMEYVPCTETSIPLPDACIDVLFTINSLDHVDELETICGELLRILKPGGLFAGSFNLNEPACAAEPQMLTEDLLRRLFFRRIAVQSYRLAEKHPEQTYKWLMENRLVTQCRTDSPHILWVKGKKKEF